MSNQKQCALENCNNTITSGITGEYCTKCYFEIKRSVKDAPALEQRIVNNPIQGTATEDEPYDIKKEHHPSLNKKYCQSCIERGYGMKLATREWTNNYFICDECLEPLINSLVNHDGERAVIERIKTEVNCDSPQLNQFYDLLNRPKELRFTRSEEILQLKNRNDIFVHHAQALVNMSQDEIRAQLEFYQVMLFNIKEGMNPLVDYINKIKADERSKANIEGIKKSKTEVTKTKLGKEEKEAKALGMTIERYREMVKKAKEREFEKITGA